MQGLAFFIEILNNTEGIEVTEQITKYLREADAAEITGFAIQTLRNKRHTGDGPPYIKKGRAVRYPLADLISWMESDRVEIER